MFHRCHGARMVRFKEAMVLQQRTERLRRASLLHRRNERLGAGLVGEGFEPCINLGVLWSAGPLARQVFRIRRIGAAATTREAPTGKCSTIPLMGLMCWGWEHFMSSNQLEHWCLVWVGNRSPSLWRYPSERTRSQCWNVSHFFPFCLWIRSRQWIWRCIVILFVMQNKLLDEVGRCFRFRTLKLRTVVLSR